MTKSILNGLTGEKNRIFWSSFTSEEFSQLCETSILSEKHKRLLYHLHDMQDVPEGDVIIEVDASAVVDRLVKRSAKKKENQMTDIVARLRQGVDPDDIPETERALDEAADEIERLREELADVRADAALLRLKVEAHVP